MKNRSRMPKQSITDHIREINDRLKIVERARRASQTAVDVGNLVIKNLGKLIIEDNAGNQRVELSGGTTAKLRFRPITGGSTSGTLYAFNDGGLTALQLGVESPEGAQNGGKVLLGRRYAILSNQPDDEDETFIWLNPFAQDPTYGQAIFMQGTWLNTYTWGDKDAIRVGRVTGLASVTTYTWAWNATTSGLHCPIVTPIHATLGIGVSLTSVTTTGFALVFSGGVTGFHFWAFRIK